MLPFLLSLFAVTLSTGTVSCHSHSGGVHYHRQYNKYQGTTRDTSINDRGFQLLQHPLRRPSFWRPRHTTTTTCSNLCLLRGGYNENYDKYQYEDEESDYEDDDDEDDVNEAEEDEATAAHQKRRNLHRNRDAPSPYPDRSQLQGKSPAAPYIPPAPYIPRPKKKKSALVEMAKSSINMSKKAALTTVQTSGKAAYYLMKPKSIQEKEIWGVWRLDQQVDTKQSTASIELTPTGFVIVRANNKIVWEVPYQFVTPVWPQACRVEFLAPAFQPHPKSKPWLLAYKGYLERKVADSSIIKMVGNLYETEKPKTIFGKPIKDAPLKYHKIGSFVGRRRIVLEDEEDEYDDDVDEDFSDDEEPPRKRRKRHEEDEEDYLDDDEYDVDEYDDDEEL